MIEMPFPYGVFPVEDTFRLRYTTDYSQAPRYPLPAILPQHHPLLQLLEGTYPLDDQPAPWWPSCVAEVDPRLRMMFSTISTREFRDGCLDASRWKQFRQTLPSYHEREVFPMSPKLAPLLENTTWCLPFTQRGASDTPAHLRLLLSCSPLSALYLSNGHQWKSCQHFRTGEYNECLVGNFYDTGVATAMVLAPQTNVWDEGAVLARTTLRVFGDQGRSWIAIGQTYHNNETLALLLLCQLAALCDQHRLPWGFLANVNALTYCTRGYLGNGLQQRLSEPQIVVEGDPFWLPAGIVEPYVDSGRHIWEKRPDSSRRLRATLSPMQSPTRATDAA